LTCDTGYVLSDQPRCVGNSLTSSTATCTVHNGPVVQMTLSGDVEPLLADPPTMHQFKRAFEAAVAAAILISSDRVQVANVAAGSVVVDFIIADPAPGAASSSQQEISADAAMERLQSTPSNVLRDSLRAEGLSCMDPCAAALAPAPGSGPSQEPPADLTDTSEAAAPPSADGGATGDVGGIRKDTWVMIAVGGSVLLVLGGALFCKNRRPAKSDSTSDDKAAVDAEGGYAGGETENPMLASHLDVAEDDHAASRATAARAARAATPLVKPPPLHNLSVIKSPPGSSGSHGRRPLQGAAAATPLRKPPSLASLSVVRSPSTRAAAATVTSQAAVRLSSVGQARTARRAAAVNPYLNTSSRPMEREWADGGVTTHAARGAAAGARPSPQRTATPEIVAAPSIML
jgi:hypothetical protein